MSPTVAASCEGPGNRKHAVKPNRTSNRRIFTSVGKVVGRVVTELSTFGHDLDHFGLKEIKAGELVGYCTPGGNRRSLHYASLRSG